MFLSFVFHKRIVSFRKRFGYGKKLKRFIAVFAATHWVKQAWSAEPILFYIDIADWVSAG